MDADFCDTVPSRHQQDREMDHRGIQKGRERGVADTRMLSFEQAVSATVIADVQISPDGKQIAYVTTSASKEAEAPSMAVWLVDADGGAPRRLTTSDAADNSPRWAPDGRRIAFVSDRKERGKSQVYVMALAGGEAVRLTDAQGAGDGDPVVAGRQAAGLHGDAGGGRGREEAPGRAERPQDHRRQAAAGRTLRDRRPGRRSDAGRRRAARGEAHLAGKPARWRSGRARLRLGSGRQRLRRGRDADTEGALRLLARPGHVRPQRRDEVARQLRGAAGDAGVLAGRLDDRLHGLRGHDAARSSRCGRSRPRAASRG